MNRSNSLASFLGEVDDGNIMGAVSPGAGIGGADGAGGLLNSGTAILSPSSVVAPIFGTSGQHVQKSAKDVDLNEVFAGEQPLRSSFVGRPPFVLFMRCVRNPLLLSLSSRPLSSSSA